MKISWLGHACFKIEMDEYTVLIDPYSEGSVPGLRPLEESADLVLCSHEHGDHNARAEVNVTGGDNEKSPFKIEVLHTYHDEVQGAKRGTNLIHILDDGTNRIAHLGDLGCELLPEQIEKLKNLDLLLIPVGGYYTIDGKQAAQLVHELQPDMVVPMHYRDDRFGFGFAEISTVDAFTECMENVTAIQGGEIYLESEDESEEEINDASDPETEAFYNEEIEAETDLSENAASQPFVIVLKPIQC